jgi:hypothetical protein
MLISRGDLKAFSAHQAGAFTPFLRDKICLVLSEISKTQGAIFEHPEHLPRDNAGVYQSYRALVAGTVRRHVTHRISIEEAISEVWVKLVGSNILQKFLSSATRSFPVLITADEAVEFLGVSWDAWCSMVDTYPAAPSPLSGSSKDSEAQFKSEDILALDKAGYFKTRPSLRRLPAGSVTLARFENYLRSSASNHTKNILRSQGRRFNREDIQDSTVVLRQTGDVFKKVVGSEENRAWESHLPDKTALVEDTFDGYALAQKLGVPYDTPEYYEKISFLTRGLRSRGLRASDVSLESGLCILTSLSEGRSVTEALRLRRTYRRNQESGNVKVA